MELRQLRMKKVVPLLVESIKELTKRVEELEKWLTVVDLV